MPKDFVVYLYDPTDPNGKLRLFLLRETDEFSEIELGHLLKYSSRSVTYEISALVDGGAAPWLNGNAEVIDIDMALTLVAEQPRIEARGTKSFSFLEHLRNSLDVRVKPFVAYCFNGDRSHNDATIVASTKQVALVLREVANNVFKQLRKTDGITRLTEVEVPVSHVLHRRQTLGLRVDTEKVEKMISELGTATAKARLELRKNFSILDPSDRGQVATAIQHDAHLREVIDTEESDWRMESVLKLYSQVSPLAATLRKFRDAQKSKTILQRFGVSKRGRIHPDYRVLGTVTGRTLVRNPSLQNISRSYRDVLIADKGKSLLYPDFKQCEPGILAHDSQDQNLISDYNAGDLYVALSETLFGDHDHRGPSKMLFLFVCYGMAPDRVAKMGSSITGLSESKVETAISAFFSRYSGIESWRQNLAAMIATKSRVGTPCGNYRSFPNVASNTAALRGAQSQRIQGTAALILKQIIIEIEERLADVEILLPMHDALLVQVPTKKINSLRFEIDAIFCEVYRRYCPTIYPKVTFEDFHQIKNQ
ncbi:DNA polymerase [Coraliomargarita sp. SDUM461003]|uniref:DNA polymerase n=1 Tax=Thalassobacterium maritimum TaxID=3041265 RepID=A0ABU1AY91_9BACT|nr:DNA polymerase [Coraliomargarita sp. SDUM461003]MDQ8209095.1 DNA polymerase [Coraliomargarita sp. SDUM461003]